MFYKLPGVETPFIKVAFDGQMLGITLSGPLSLLDEEKDREYYKVISYSHGGFDIAFFSADEEKIDFLENFLMEANHKEYCRNIIKSIFYNIRKAVKENKENLVLDEDGEFRSYRQV